MNNNTKTKASKCLKAMLGGSILNRKRLGDMGLADNNDSLHSYASYLRNKRFIPIESTKNPNGTCDYFMLSEEIARYKDPIQRIKQQEEMTSLIECERQQKLIEDVSTFLNRLIEFPALWCFWSDLPFRLDEIRIEINALLSNEKSINQ